MKPVIVLTGKAQTVFALMALKAKEQPGITLKELK
jgi:hypothetical protein